MLRLGEARTKPHVLPCLWVVAFLVTVALPIYILPIELYLQLVTVALPFYTLSIPLYPVASRGR